MFSLPGAVRQMFCECRLTHILLMSYKHQTNLDMLTTVAVSLSNQHGFTLLCPYKFHMHTSVSQSVTFYHHTKAEEHLCMTTHIFHKA